MKFQRPVYYTGNLVPFLQQHPSLLRLYAGTLLLLSPLLLPPLVVYVYWEDLWGEVTEGMKVLYEATVGHHVVRTRP